MKILWDSKRPKIRRQKAEPFRLGDEIPEGYFTETELSSLADKGKVKIIETRVVDLDAAPKKAEPEKAEPEKAEPKKAEPKKAEPEKAEPEKSKKTTPTKRGKW